MRWCAAVLSVLGSRAALIRAGGTAAVLLPVGLAAVCHAVPLRAAAVPVMPRPPLAFTESLVNLGLLEEGAPAAAPFRFVNVGPTPLRLLSFAPSCGCLQPSAPKEVYAPGEGGTFVVRADTAGESTAAGTSVKQHHVDVTYDDGTGPRVGRVHLKFTLPARRVAVEPRLLTVYQFSDTPTVQPITITDRRVPPLKVLRVESASPHVAVAADVAPGDDPLRATLTVTVPAPPAKPVRTLVLVHTDDPLQPVLYIPVMVFGPASDTAASGPRTPR